MQAELLEKKRFAEEENRTKTKRAAGKVRDEGRTDSHVALFEDRTEEETASAEAKEKVLREIEAFLFRHSAGEKKSALEKRRSLAEWFRGRTLPDRLLVCYMIEKGRTGAVTDSDVKIARSSYVPNPEIIKKQLLGAEAEDEEKEKSLERKRRKSQGRTLRPENKRSKTERFFDRQRLSDGRLMPEAEYGIFGITEEGQDQDGNLKEALQQSWQEDLTESPSDFTKESAGEDHSPRRLGSGRRKEFEENLRKLRNVFREDKDSRNAEEAGFRERSGLGSLKTIAGMKNLSAFSTESLGEAPPKRREGTAPILSLSGLIAACLERRASEADVIDQYLGMDQLYQDFRAGSMKTPDEADDLRKYGEEETVRAMLRKEAVSSLGFPSDQEMYTYIVRQYAKKLYETAFLKDDGTMLTADDRRNEAGSRRAERALALKILKKYGVDISGFGPSAGTTAADIQYICQLLMR